MHLCQKVVCMDKFSGDWHRDGLFLWVDYNKDCSFSEGNSWWQGKTIDGFSTCFQSLTWCPLTSSCLWVLSSVKSFGACKFEFVA